MSSKNQSRGITNVAQRLLVFAIGTPLIVLLIFLQAERWHWPLNLIILIVSTWESFEAAQLFGMNPHKSFLRSMGVALTGVSMPLAGFLWVTDLLPTSSLLPIYTAMVMATLFVQVFRQQHDVKKISPGIGRHLAVLAYPGLLSAHLIMISKIPDSSLVYLAFIAGVFSNDSMAYIGGRFFGRKGNKLVPISPNKTLVGFVFGYVSSSLGLLLVYLVVPHIFPGGIAAVIGLGLIVGFSTIAGDLIESGLKRSVKAKDSGQAIPGRGGLLDSLDSTLYSAPVFYYAYQILNNIWVMQ